MTSLIQLKHTTSVFLLALALGCFGLLSTVQAVSPPPDGGYANFTTAEGDNALQSLSSGIANTAVGWFSLHDTITGSFNTGVGAGALDLNTGNENTATGTGALLLNTAGVRNTAIGAFALVNNSTGNDNTAVGDRALQNTSTVGMATGISNNAVGRQALFNNTTGSFNQAMGVNALLNNTTGSLNVAIGDDAELNTTGSANVTVGAGNSGPNGITTGNNNVAVGTHAGLGITAGINNTCLGDSAGSNIATASGNIYIGNGVNPPGPAFEFNTVRIGDNLPTGAQCFIGGIFNVVPVAGSHLATIGPGGQLADFTASSRRFKKDITPIDKISEGVLALKPVTFHYKNDNTNEPEFGFVAEDVAEVNPDWITRDREGEIFGVRYEVIPILLLNEFLKEHKKVEEQQATIAELKSTVAQQQKGMEVLTAQLKEQATEIQKVSAQLQVSKPAPQVVANKP